MRGSPPLALDERRGIRQHALRFGGNLVLTGTDDDGGRRDARFGDDFEHVAKKRFSGHRVQHFGLGRSHARAFAGRQNDRQASPIGRPGLHKCLRGVVLAEAIDRRKLRFSAQANAAIAAKALVPTPPTTESANFWR